MKTLAENEENESKQQRSKPAARSAVAARSVAVAAAATSASMRQSNLSSSIVDTDGNEKESKRHCNIIELFFFYIFF